jgi:hypothetical protein
MGAIESIQLRENKEGIFIVSVKDIPDYPIVYLRLCKQKDSDNYCVAESCDVLGEFTGHRKIIIVGFRNQINPDIINEQVFYLSTASNSIELLEEFFKVKIKLSTVQSDNMFWLPFSGFGYDKNDIKDQIDLEQKTKLLKDFFDCSTHRKKATKTAKQCLHSRFGNSDPNMSQISYCLGGKFWENNPALFEILNIDALPTLKEYINKIPCYISQTSFESNIDCSRYLNEYIGSALPQNYSTPLLKQKEEALTKHMKYKWLREDILFDYRVLYILKEKALLKFGEKMMNGKVVRTELPFEQFFFSYNTWDLYIYFLNKLYNINPDYFVKNVSTILYR